MRRKKISLSGRVREFLWPRSGWRRTFSYLFHRMARLPGSPYFVAAGFACGAALSFTPFVGMHIALACLLAWTIRASLLSAAIGTVVGNPWTFPFIWIWIYESGRWMLDESGGEVAEELNFSEFFGSFTEAFLRFDLVYLVETAWPVFWPMVIGGIPTALVVWFVFYLPLKPVVAAYQRRRWIRCMKKQQEARDE
ncbi:MAG: DUF2062 domain-containing protein [Rhodospirillales bacterium]|nr:DUF2062 domain-containing protein [Rhodospirillales bacterium]